MKVTMLCILILFAGCEQSDVRQAPAQATPTTAPETAGQRFKRAQVEWREVRERVQARDEWLQANDPERLRLSRLEDEKYLEYAAATDDLE